MSEENTVKTGKEILDTFFQSILSIEGVDSEIANALLELYNEGKFTESNVLNKIRKIRETNAN
ncbi:hypothetical protein AGMMS49573_08050 [Endomicrobiia bacterium]|nr:hypothetical protein AGMMS49523_01270 [Endomicrobiia bacterium]GHT10844.1 hypothetical protein AGMMS49571_00160 [Endomicrobiia bacterium]GHT16992.1 hypothetical protein AGMMS49573_08050 [Endomicrobiia bacterium]GHT20746.1 hypothetical protein AGMMS49929_08180 [Endomicrobiia bacterium]GHT25934.1 hypothetical protein AGMMS49995_01280 [Endomicrobiia bacterium]